MSRSGSSILASMPEDPVMERRGLPLLMLPSRAQILPTLPEKGAEITAWVEVARTSGELTREWLETHLEAVDELMQRYLLSRDSLEALPAAELLERERLLAAERISAAEGRIRAISLELEGIADRKWAIELGPTIGYRGWPVHINWTHWEEVTGRHSGFVSDLSFAYPIDLDRGFIVPRVHAIYESAEQSN